MSKIKVNNSVALTHADNKALFDKACAKKIISVSNSAPLVTGGNINAPLGALVYVRPKAIEVLTAPQVADKIAKAEQNGKWGDKVVSIKLKEYAGSVAPDDGLKSDTYNASTNYATMARGVFNYTTAWRSTELEEITVGAMQEDHRANQLEASMRTLAIHRNKFFFDGVSTNVDAPVEGLLNASNLGAYTTVQAGVGGDTEWNSKTPDEIVNDIVDALSALNAKSAGLSDEGLEGGKGKVVIAVASDSIRALDRTNNFGLTARKLLKEMYGDKVEFVSVPQMNKADSSSDVMYAIYTEKEIPTLINSYVEMARVYPLNVEDSQVSQKLSAGTSGCIVQFPMFVVRFNGIG